MRVSNGLLVLGREGRRLFSRVAGPAHQVEIYDRDPDAAPALTRLADLPRQEIGMEVARHIWKKREQREHDDEQDPGDSAELDRR